MPNQPTKGSIDCQHCSSRPADRYLFTTFIRTGGCDATKHTTYVCGPCAADADRWLDRIGFRVDDRPAGDDSIEWDALIEMLPDRA